MLTPKIDNQCKNNRCSIFAKHLGLLATVFLTMILQSQCCYATDNIDSLIAKFDMVPTLDARTVIDGKPYRFIRHANTPKVQTRIDARYDGDVSPEIADLMKGLKRSIKTEYLPTEDDIKRIVPCVNLWEDGTDYLLLSYKTKSGMTIYIQDGININIKITSGLSCNLDDVKQYVVDLATEILDLSSADEQMRINPRIEAIPVEIGDSRAGLIDFGQAPVRGGPDWYSIPFWWSDGHSVVLLLSKIDFVKEMTIARSRTGPPKPRIFKSRVISFTKL